MLARAVVKGSEGHDSGLMDISLGCMYPRVDDRPDTAIPITASRRISSHRSSSFDKIRPRMIGCSSRANIMPLTRKLRRFVLLPSR